MSNPWMSVRLAGPLGWGWGAHSHGHCSWTVFQDRTVFFSHDNQPEQYFGLFFSPAEQTPRSYPWHASCSRYQGSLNPISHFFLDRATRHEARILLRRPFSHLIAADSSMQVFVCTKTSNNHIDKVSRREKSNVDRHNSSPLCTLLRDINDRDNRSDMVYG